MLLGIHLTLMIGPTVPIPAPLPLSEALVSAEVTHSDQGRSGFSLTFETGRGGALAALDHPLLTLPLLRPNNRVILIVTFSAMPVVLMDGYITRQQLQPGDRPGTSRITVIGEDVSLAMDREDRSVEHPAQEETIIANKLIAQAGLIPMVIPPVAVDPALPIERIPVQQGTDLDYLNQMAARHGYVFYVIPGPLPGLNTGYWGPPVRMGVPQSALSVDLGPETNVKNIQFGSDGNGPTLVEGQVQDRLSNQAIPVMTFASLRVPLSVMPLWLVNQPDVRRTQLRESGLSAMQAFARAQGQVDAAADAVTATGELDASRYGRLLQPRGLVGVRGAGWTYDGFWYVREVRHALSRGDYSQHFSLARDGYGSTTPIVPVF
jgi:hypothetical protein